MNFPKLPEYLDRWVLNKMIRHNNSEFAFCFMCRWLIIGIKMILDENVCREDVNPNSTSHLPTRNKYASSASVAARNRSLQLIVFDAITSMLTPIPEVCNIFKSYSIHLESNEFFHLFSLSYVASVCSFLIRRPPSSTGAVCICLYHFIDILTWHLYGMGLSCT